MISILSLVLEAHDDNLNIHRFYAIHVGKNLFGLAIHIEYGRKELFRQSRGQKKTYMAESLQEAKKKVQQILKKRFSSPRRDGKTLRPSYTLIHAQTQTDSFPVSDWIPHTSS